MARARARAVWCGGCVCAAGTEEQRRSKIGTHRALMCRGERGRRAWRRIMGVRDEVTTHHDEVTTHLKTVASNHRRFAPAAARARSSEPAAASAATAAAQHGEARRTKTVEGHKGAQRGDSSEPPSVAVCGSAVAEAAVCRRLWVCGRGGGIVSRGLVSLRRGLRAADSWRRRHVRVRAEAQSSRVSYYITMRSRHIIDEADSEKHPRARRRAAARLLPRSRRSPSAVVLAPRSRGGLHRGRRFEVSSALRGLALATQSEVGRASR